MSGGYQPRSTGRPPGPPPGSHLRDAPLTVSIRDGQLRITVGIDTIKYAVEIDPSLSRYDDETGDFIEPTLTDIDTFVVGMQRALEREDEQGSTLVHQILDQAALWAIEQGAEGIELP